MKSVPKIWIEYELNMNQLLIFVVQCDIVLEDDGVVTLWPLEINIFGDAVSRRKSSIKQIGRCSESSNKKLKIAVCRQRRFINNLM
jgi:hypothetical protein